MRHLLFATVLVTFAAAGMQPRQAASFDPAGKWTYSTHDDQGAPISGTMEIAGKPGAYTGTIVSGPGRELKVSDVLTSPNGMIVIADLPDGGVAVVKVWKDADGKLGAGWGPIRNVIPATVERAKP
jgi:hypothetical protein